MAHKARPSALTVLDVAVIVFTSAAVVLLLGGRTRGVFLTASFRLVDPLRPALFAAVLLLLRLVLDRKAPPLPALPRSMPSLLQEELARLRSDRPASRRLRWYALAAGLGSFVWILPQALRLGDVPDPGDPVFSAWRIAVLTHQLVTDPVHLWDGNIFFPQRLTIAYSDSLFLQSLIAAPFLIARTDPLLVANALMVVSYPARGLAFFYTAWRITGSPEAALVSALVGAWSPFYPQHYSQLELNWTMFVPLAILGLMRMLAEPRWRSGALFGAAVAAQCLSSMYVAAMLVTFLVPLGLILAVAWGTRLSASTMKAGAAATASLLPVVLFLAVPYMHARQATGERSIAEVSDGSAAARDYGDAHIRLVSYQWQSGRDHRPERELFPGSSSLVLGAIGMVPPLSPIAIAVVGAGAAAFDWSLGLKGLTYDDLYRRSAVYRGMRVPARFSVMVHATLALLAAFGARRLIHLGRTPRVRSGACSALVLAVLFDLRMDPRLQPYRRDAPALYNRVTADMVLAELPQQNHEIDYMYFSTRHWARLLGGYSGFIPLDDEVVRGFAEFPSPKALARLHAFGATHVTYNCAFEMQRERCQEVFTALDGNRSIELVASEQWRRAEVRLYRFVVGRRSSVVGRRSSVVDRRSSITDY